MKNPNRIVAYAIAFLGFLVALLPVVAAADWKTMAGAIAGLTASASVAIVWLKGWQQQEKAEQTAWIQARHAAAQAEEIAAAQAAAQQASAPRKPGVAIPPGLPR